SITALCVPPDLPSFPTRRSSDLTQGVDAIARLADDVHQRGTLHARPNVEQTLAGTRAQLIQFAGHTAQTRGVDRVDADTDLTGRSEEHTSELQSRVDLVCRLLLE